MSLDRRGFVGLFEEPLDRPHVEELVRIWLEKYGHVEQTLGSGAQVLTQVLRSMTDIVWEKNMQFRVLSGEQFAWIYLTQDRYVIETSGLSSDGGQILCHDVLMVPNCSEVIDEQNNQRLDELEALGLM